MKDSNYKMRSAAMMNRKILFTFLTVLAVPFLFAQNSWAVVQYENDGAVQNNQGGFNLPAQGTCPAGIANGYAGIDTRPECQALRLNFVTSGTCSADTTRSWST